MPMRSTQFHTPIAPTSDHLKAASAAESGAAESIASAVCWMTTKDASVAATRNAALKAFSAPGIACPPGVGMVVCCRIPPEDRSPV